MPMRKSSISLIGISTCRKGDDLNKLFRLLATADGSARTARAIATLEVHELNVWLTARLAGQQAIPNRAHIAFASKQIEQFEKDPKKMDLTPPAEPPDGPPIGTDEDWDWPE